MRVICSKAVDYAKMFAKSAISWVTALKRNAHEGFIKFQQNCCSSMARTEEPDVNFLLRQPLLSCTGGWKLRASKDDLRAVLEAFPRSYEMWRKAVIEASALRRKSLSLGVRKL